MDRIRQLYEIHKKLHNVLHDPLYVAIIEEDKLTEIVKVLEDFVFELEEDCRIQEYDNSRLQDALAENLNLVEENYENQRKIQDLEQQIYCLEEKLDYAITELHLYQDREL